MTSRRAFLMGYTDGDLGDAPISAREAERYRPEIAGHVDSYLNGYHDRLSGDDFRYRLSVRESALGMGNFCKLCGNPFYGPHQHGKERV